LDSGKVAAYITDFPNAELVKHDKVIPIPHLGASTEESEDNCAVKAVREISDYLKHGNIKNSVNMPSATLDENPDCAARVGILHKNVPKMISKISDAFSKNDINIENMVNKSRKETAYTLMDLVQEPSQEILDELQSIDDIIRVIRFK
ncbi:MAG: 3-phosphoglycerate dehydrogenase, partial [Erysipelotrichaceae bacterium]|nr:3-phosphoglycerate dehydrogenase [Erysipelotrichaceae bacterium]